MATVPVEPGDQDVEAALRLLNAPEQDLFSVLGIQAERLELAEQRLAAGRPVPPWAAQESFDRVLSPQRASVRELQEYATRGLSFAKQLITRFEPELRSLVCDGTKVRKEIEDLGADVKAAVKYLASAIIGAMIANLPAALAAGAASICATVAVLLLKRNLTTFCAIAPDAGAWLSEPQKR